MINQDYFFNPTNEQRHQLLKESLTHAGRPEDYENILELLNPPQDIFQLAPALSLRNIRVGIIGFGLAGMAAAYELRKLGADITIFDAENKRIGGRVYTQYFDNSDLYGELGAMRIPVSHETTWHYINLFNLDTESRSSPQSNNFLYVHNIRLRREPSGQNITEMLYPYYDLSYSEKNIPYDTLSSYATDTVLNNLQPQIRTEILKILPQYSYEYAAATLLSNRQVFEMLGLSQGAINLMSSVDPFVSAFLNISYDDTMSGNYTLDFLNTYKISRGMVNLPLAFYKSLNSDNPPEINYLLSTLGKINIRFGHTINGIFKSYIDNKVNLRFVNNKGTELLESFDYVICTIPFSTLRTIDIYPYFSNQKMQAIRELNYMDGQKTLFLCRRRFWEENKPYGNINGGISFTDLPIQSIVYPTDHIRCENCSYNEPGVITASYNLSQDSTRLSNQSIHNRFNLIKRNVEEVHGLPAGYLDTLIDSYKTLHWNSEHWFRGAFAASYPGQKVNLLYSMIQPEYNGRVFFAGEHVSVKQGWMQGALYSGKNTANQLAVHINASII